MAKVPFNPSGVQAKQTELYALTADGLKGQIGLLTSDFRGWVRDNFSLTQTQDNYLRDMDEEFLGYLSGETGEALHYQLPIRLEVGPIIIDDGSKRFKVKSTSERTLFKGLPSFVTGELVFTVDYVAD